MMLLGEEGRRKMENQTKTNDQLFNDYLTLITNTHTPKSFYEAKRKTLQAKKSTTVN